MADLTPALLAPEPERQAPSAERAAKGGLEPAAGLLAGPTMGAPPPLLPAQLLVLQRLVGNGAVAGLIAPRPPTVVQRDDPPGGGGGAAAPTAKGGTSKQGILDGVLIAHYNEANQFVTSHVADLSKEMQLVQTDGGPVPAVLMTAAMKGRELVSTTAGGGANEIDDVTYDQVDAWFDQYNQAITFAEAERASLAAQKMHDLTASAQSDQAQITAAQQAAADKKAAAFANSQTSLLKALYDWSTALFDSGVGIADTIAQGTSLEAELRTLGQTALAQAGPNAGSVKPSYLMPEADKLLPFLKAVDQSIAALQLAMTAASLLTPQKTAQAKAETTIGDAVSLASAVGTLIGAEVGVGLIINLYITPAVNACIDAMGKLDALGNKINKELIENGMYDKVNWDLEPGGRPLFDFMLAVRSANDPSGVPSPIPAQVLSYLGQNADDVNAGTGGKDTLPTTGFWFWKKADKSKAAPWVFAHRDDLWAMFYGGASPNANG